MAVATGTAALIAAGIAAGGTAYAAHSASSAQSKGYKSQADANREALAYQERKDAEDRRIEERAYADKKRRYDDWLAMRPGGPASGGGGRLPGGFTQVPGGTPGVLPPIRGGAPLADLATNPEGAQPTPEMSNGGRTLAPVPLEAPQQVAGRGGMPLAELARMNERNQFYGQGA